MQREGEGGREREIERWLGEVVSCYLCGEGAGQTLLTESNLPELFLRSDHRLPFPWCWYWWGYCWSPGSPCSRSKTGFW